MSTAARIIAPLLLALAAIHAAAGTAHADEASPAILAGATLPVTHADGPIIVQVNAPADSWQIKRAARRFDAQLADVVIRTSGDCATADVCVTVITGRWGQADQLRLSDGYVVNWGGLTVYSGTSTRTIYLNRYGNPRIGYRVHASAHELGHVLGLAHHDEAGVMAEEYDLKTSLLSDEEVYLIEGSIAAGRAALLAQDGAVA